MPDGYPCLVRNGRVVFGNYVQHAIVCESTLCIATNRAIFYSIRINLILTTIWLVVSSRSDCRSFLLLKEAFSQLPLSDTQSSDKKLRRMRVRITVYEGLRYKRMASKKG